MSDHKITPAAVSAAASGDMDNFMVAITPGGIERQEAMGQAALVGTLGILPKECPRQQLEKLGFKFGADSDDLFVNVTFPAGWSKKATDHSMWSNLLDDKGRKRGAIFYKAAFYDRSAHMSLERRYSYGTQYLNADLTPFDWNKDGASRRPAKARAAATDTATGQTLWHSEEWPDGAQNWKEQDERKNAAKVFLETNFPDWNNELAYWEAPAEQPRSEVVAG
jgi:hypothetical protein